MVVPRTEAERVRKQLHEAGLLETRLRIVIDGDQIRIPLQATPSDAQYPLETFDFEELPAPPGDYRSRLPEEIRPNLPTSFDRVGDIIVIRLPDAVQAQAEAIGQALLDTERSAHVVAIDRGVGGEFRIRDVSVIAGEDRLTTVHKEHGIRLRVDLSKAYFSPRLATERLRVAQMAAQHECVVDLFAGIGPMAILVAKRSQGHVHAVDANPDAFRLLEQNIRLNRVSNVLAANEDAGEYLAADEEATCIIMDLPHGARRYLPAALDVAARTGGSGVVYYYETLERASVPNRTQEIEAMHAAFKVVAVREVHTYSPVESQFAFDLATRD
jgi:tRNA (guanine37-N1)-methyltransferase